MEMKIIKELSTEIDLKKGLRTWIEIDKEAIRRNHDFFRSWIPASAKMFAVVKSNAYGHDLVKYAELLSGLGVEGLAVDSIEEAVALRAARIEKPILVLGYTLPVHFQLASQEGIELSISSKESLEKLVEKVRERKVRHLKIHFKVDTGMHRQGFDEEGLKEVLVELKEIPGIEIVGIYSHLAAPTEKKFEKETRDQLKAFKQMEELARNLGYKDLLTHICATGGSLFYPEEVGSLARIGMGLYGYWPSEEAKEYMNRKGELFPALTWKTVVGEIKEVRKGEGIGYSFTEKLDRDSKIAICPVGYWHGYPRALSGKGEVAIKGKRAKVLGRISMDMIIVDVTDILELDIGEEVVIVGKEISAEELAKKIDTTPYEFLTRINPQIPRLYI